MKNLRFYVFLVLSFLFVSACNTNSGQLKDKKNLRSAVFAGGCFWCMEHPFEHLKGVKEVISGYSGGEITNPNYRQVSSGITKHRESIKVIYDPNLISYNKLLDVFWKQIDPTDNGGQFVDRGFQYTTAIFYNNKTEKELAERSKKKLEKSNKFDKPIVTKIIPYKNFYTAEEYHQDYYKKNPDNYYRYRKGSGRDQFLKKIWGKKIKVDKKETGFKMPSKEELKNKLTRLQYEVTQNEATEPAFNNKYWNNHKEGIYVDIISGEALFSSTDKYESGSGWPSFTKPINKNNIIENTDASLGMLRIELKSKKAKSHLGHVFDDGPKPKGLRYCINSAALRFIPKEKLEKEGYGKYAYLFK